jgi:hypothetical protein
MLSINIFNLRGVHKKLNNQLYTHIIGQYCVFGAAGTLNAPAGHKGATRSLFGYNYPAC